MAKLSFWKLRFLLRTSKLHSLDKFYYGCLQRSTVIFLCIKDVVMLIHFETSRNRKKYILCLVSQQSIDEVNVEVQLVKIDNNNFRTCMVLLWRCRRTRWVRNRGLWGCACQKYFCMSDRGGLYSMCVRMAASKCLHHKGEYFFCVRKVLFHTVLQTWQP